jgi:hypothetical protein
MGFLAQSTTGRIQKNLFITLMGTSGAGKTTFACDGPFPYVLQTEEGSNHLAHVRRSPLMKAYRDVFQVIDELLTEPHDFKTLVFDSLDHFEIILWADICRENNVREITEMPYGKGYALALKVWQELMQKLLKLREKMHIIMICHSQIKTINDPMKSAPYDRHELKLNQKASSLVKEVSDAVLFATKEIIVRDVKGGKGKASGDGAHVLYTHGMPGHEGKNRFGLPYQMPLEFGVFWETLQQSSPQDPDVLIAQIGGLLELVKDPAIKQKAADTVTAAGKDSAQLVKILNRLEVLTNNTN